MIVASPVTSSVSLLPIPLVATEATEAPVALPSMGAIAPPDITLPAVAPNPAAPPTIAAFLSAAHPLIRQTATKQATRLRLPIKVFLKPLSKSF